MIPSFDRSLLGRSLFAGIAGLTGSFAVAGLTPGFIAAPIDGALARAMPGVVVTFAITVLGKFGQRINLLTALLVAVVLLALAARAGILITRALDREAAAPLPAAFLAWIVAWALTGAPVLALGTAGGVAAGLGIGSLIAAAAVPSPRTAAFKRDRRALISGVGTVIAGLALAAGGWLFKDFPGTGGGGTAGTSGSGGAGSSGTDGSGRSVSAPTKAGKAGGTDWTTDAEIDDLLALAGDRSLDVDGLEALVSDGFYEVDINSIHPDVDPAEWTLSVTGAVDSPAAYNHADIVEMGTEHRFVSLRCVGEDLNGKQMDNALWTGVPIMPILDDANPRGEFVMLRAADNYFEEFPIEALEDGFLAYGMNGEPLPRGHGAPVRALIPGHWGEINVKWITEIEILEKEQKGYWERRGWHGTGPVNTVAKLHVTDHLDDGRILVGGHTYAGTRGIDRVEVSTDGGDSWVEAELSEPLPGNDVWRQWVHTYDSPGTTHEVVVRATDGTGTLQPENRQQAFPSGATGWVSKSIRG